MPESTVTFVGPRPTVRRVQEMRIEADVILNMLRAFDGKRIYQLETVIPEDARVVGVTVDEAFNTIHLYIESESFALLPLGALPPPMYMQVSVLIPPDAECNQ